MIDSYPKAYLYKRIVQAKLFIDEHYSHPIDLGNIAGSASFSKFHFIRLFKACYGKTPHQYLVKVRIERAMKLLEKRKLVAEACYAVGFESVSSFTTLFKKYTGASPNEYHLRFTERQSQIKSLPLNYIPNCFVESNGWKKSNFEEVV